MARTKIPAEFSSTPGIVDNSSATAITIDSAGAATFSGNVTAGTSAYGGTPNTSSSLVLTNSSHNYITIGSGSTSEGGILFADAADNDTGVISYRHDTNSLTFVTNAATRMTLDANGNLLVGKTASSFTTAGVQLQSNGELYVTRNGGAPVSLNRLSDDGATLAFAQDGTTVGSIGTKDGVPYFAGPNATTGGFRIDSSGTNGVIIPTTNTGANRDAAMDLGYSSGGTNIRFKDLYLSGTVNAGSGLAAAISNAANIVLAPNASNVSDIYTSSGPIRFLTPGGASLGMVIDASGNVGIGTSDPKSTLEVKGTFGGPATSGSAAGFISRFSQTSGGGSLDFGFGDPYSWLQSRASSNYSVNYALALNPNGGNVGIGVTAPATKLTIDAPAADRETIRLATYYSPIDNLARGGISWHDGGAVTGQIDTRYTGTTVDMHLGHLYNLGYNTTSKVIIKGNGNVEIPDGNLSFAAGHGIDFSATANAGGTGNATGSELLDDYEEGTWYPYLGTDAQLGGAASGNYNNKYVKIGRFVHCTGWFSVWDWANITSGTYIMIRNLPFAPEHHSTGLKVSYASNLGSSTYGYGHTGLSAFYLLIGGSNGAPAHFGRAAAPTSGTAYAMLSITYYTDS